GALVGQLAAADQADVLALDQRAVGRQAVLRLIATLPPALIRLCPPHPLPIAPPWPPADRATVCRSGHWRRLGTADGGCSWRRARGRGRQTDRQMRRTTATLPAPQRANLMTAPRCAWGFSEWGWAGLGDLVRRLGRLADRLLLPLVTRRFDLPSHRKSPCPRIRRRDSFRWGEGLTFRPFQPEESGEKSISGRGEDGGFDDLT
ncbi:hypothetical protein SAMN06295951_1311, partial [Pseudomonas panipatensis]